MQQLQNKACLLLDALFAYPAALRKRVHQLQPQLSQHSISCLANHPPPHTQVLTKYCVFSALDMSTLSAQGVIDAVERSRSRLGVDTIDLLQLYWQDYAIPK